MFGEGFGIVHLIVIASDIKKIVGSGGMISSVKGVIARIANGTRR